MKYAADGVPLVVLAGEQYGTGSSRDWAAKGTLLLGVRAVIAKSFERIHRSNLIGMGVLPLQFEPGQDAQTLGLTGDEVISIDGIAARRHAEEAADGARAGGQDVHRDRAHRHAAGGRVRRPRRHPAVRAAPARRGAQEVASPSFRSGSSI